MPRTFQLGLAFGAGLLVAGGAVCCTTSKPPVVVQAAPHSSGKVKAAYSTDWCATLICERDGFGEHDCECTQYKE